MRLHYNGKYNENPESLPHGEHMPGAVKFKEPEDNKKLSLIATIISIVIFIGLYALAYLRCGEYIRNGNENGQSIGCLIALLTMFPHEILHAICFKEDVYLYTNLSRGMLFVVGPEKMSKARFIIMSFLPNIVFGFVPYIIGMVFPNMVLLVTMGALCISMGAGDYINIFNALTQMPKGSRTYLYQFNSYWYMP